MHGQIDMDRSLAQDFGNARAAIRDDNRFRAGPYEFSSDIDASLFGASRAKGRDDLQHNRLFLRAYRLLGILV